MDKLTPQIPFTTGTHASACSIDWSSWSLLTGRPSSLMSNKSYGFLTLRSDQEQGARLIASFEALSEGWDGDGASPPSPYTVENAREAFRLFAEALPIPDITPNSNGTISFDWDTENGYAYCEVGKTRMSMYVKPQAGASYHLDGQIAPSIWLQAVNLVSAILYPRPSGGKSLAETIFSYDPSSAPARG